MQNEKEKVEELVVDRRNAEDFEAVCWKVDTTGVAPNTVLKPAQGIMLLVSADDKKKTKSGEPITMHGLLNPGKKNKFLFGFTPYEKCEITAIDQSSEFSAEWGLAGADAIVCNDPLLGVQCDLVAVGTYYYKIESYYDFINAFPWERGLLTRTKIREILREKTAGVFKGVLAPELGGGIEKAYGRLTAINARLRTELNKCLQKMGLTVSEVAVKRIDFSPEFKLIHKNFDFATIETKLKKIRNEGRRDDVDVDIMETQGVTVPIIDAVNGKTSEPKYEREDREDKNAFVYCSNCGAKLYKGDKFCKKCGKELR